MKETRSWPNFPAFTDFATVSGERLFLTQQITPRQLKFTTDGNDMFVDFSLSVSNANLRGDVLLASSPTVPDGFHVEPHDDGSKAAAGMIRNGDRVGDWGEWRKDGTPKAGGSYVHGKRHGPWTFWGPDGQVRSAGAYLYGTKEGEWVETGKGGERSTVSYRGGKKYGLERVWYPNGSALKSETTWYADVKDGPTSTWYESGQLQSRGRYLKDRPVGLWEYWHPDGSLDEEQTVVFDRCP